VTIKLLPLCALRHPQTYCRVKLCYFCERLKEHAELFTKQKERATICFFKQFSYKQINRTKWLEVDIIKKSLKFFVPCEVITSSFASVIVSWFSLSCAVSRRSSEQTAVVYVANNIVWNNRLLQYNNKPCYAVRQWWRRCSRLTLCGGSLSESTM
jgi:hypothetical protein